jgi:soluble lytic murein transglycosylase-like protein
MINLEKIATDGIKLSIAVMVLVIALAIQCEVTERRHMEELRQKDLLMQQYQTDQDEINKTLKEMRKYKPKASRKEACQFVAKTKYFGIPGKVARLSAAAETQYTMTARGPCGERGTHQAMYFTMRAYFPEADAGNVMYWEVASWLYLKECFDRAGGRVLETVARHNSGRENRNPMWAARKHVSRCRVILRRMG